MSEVEKAKVVVKEEDNVVSEKDQQSLSPSSSSSSSYSKRRTSSMALFTSPKLKMGCKCGKKFDMEEWMILCNTCKQWHHSACLKEDGVDIGDEEQHMVGSMDYDFTCKTCGKEGGASFSRGSIPFMHVVLTALYNLQKEYEAKQDGSETNAGPHLFSIVQDVLPFIEKHRRALLSWLSDSTIVDRDIKKSLKRNHSFLIKGADDTCTIAAVEPWQLVKTLVDEDSESDHPSKKSKRMYYLPTEDPRAVTLPFTHEQWRYEYAAPVQFQNGLPSAFQTVRWIGSPAISSGDRADQLKLLEENMVVQGYKGYALARATHGVLTGKWYFEVEIVCDEENTTALPDTQQPHWRIGWAQKHATLQAPVGYDKYSYSWRDIKGTKFHNSRGTPYSKEGYKPGDVLGFEIDLPQPVSSSVLPMQSNISHVAVKSGQRPFIAERLKTLDDASNLKHVPGSQLICYKNGELQGVMFENILEGTYYPAVSLYNNAKVRMNFGPNFKHAAPEGCQPFSESYIQTLAAQSLAETLAKVLNATDIRQHKLNAQEYCKKRDPSVPLSTAFALKEEPPMNGTKAQQKEWRKYLSDLPFIVEEVRLEDFPAKLRPKKASVGRRKLLAKTTGTGPSPTPASPSTS
eukprot:m.9387 g.9387  ORF g.9387 m.9387 type:complete len:629 (+) comp3447_c0_seq1:27-1913(+)